MCLNASCTKHTHFTQLSFYPHIHELLLAKDELSLAPAQTTRLRCKRESCFPPYTQQQVFPWDFQSLGAQLDTDHFHIPVFICFRGHKPDQSSLILSSHPPKPAVKPGSFTAQGKSPFHFSTSSHRQSLTALHQLQEGILWQQCHVPQHHPCSVQGTALAGSQGSWVPALLQFLPLHNEVLALQGGHQLEILI